MRKKLFKFACMLIILLGLIGNSFAQNDFTVWSPTTDNCNNLLKPIKAGANISFPVLVTNNLTVSATVSINTAVMGSVAPWATVNASNVTIAPGQTTGFNVTIAVPAGTATNNYGFWVSLKAVDANNVNRDFNYRTQFG